MTMLITLRSQMYPVKVKNVMRYDFIIEGDKHYLAVDCPDRAWYFDNADIISIYLEDKEVI